MSNGFLSQEEIDSLLKGSDSTSSNVVNNKELTDIEKDLLGEVGNISMGAAATALYQIINNKVNITTPIVKVTTLKEIKESLTLPNILLDVEYTSGIVGRNILAMKTGDAALIANLMMGGDGSNVSEELSEIEISAVQEAMNQMIGSAATSMSTMFSRMVNISPPSSKIWTNQGETISDSINETDDVIEVTFDMQIGDMLESKIMQILPYDTAKKIVSIMMGTENLSQEEVVETLNSIDTKQDEIFAAPEREYVQPERTYAEPQRTYAEPSVNYSNSSNYIEPKPAVEVNKASFQPLSQGNVSEPIHNIDLIMDVPLEVSVVLGRTKKSIREILDLGTGSLISLDKLAEEPVEVLINGKKIALGEVVVVDESFGVRITSIVSGVDRIKSLK